MATTRSPNAVITPLDGPATGSRPRRGTAPETLGFDLGYEQGFLDGLSAAGPIVTAISPTQGTVIAALATIAFQVIDSNNVAAADISIVVHFIDATSVTIWNGSVFAVGYTAGSSVTPTSGGQAFVLAADTPGWTQTVSRVVVTAEDSIGNDSTSTVGSWIRLVAEEAPEPEPQPDPIAAPFEEGDVEYVDHVQHALSRLIWQDARLP